jgi:hypothetical protein
MMSIAGSVPKAVLAARDLTYWDGSMQRRNDELEVKAEHSVEVPVRIWNACPMEVVAER